MRICLKLVEENDGEDGHTGTSLKYRITSGLQTGMNW